LTIIYPACRMSSTLLSGLLLIYLFNLVTAVSYPQIANFATRQCGHWTYDEQSTWGTLNCTASLINPTPVPNFCGNGQFQSPVDIEPSGQRVDDTLTRLVFVDYSAQNNVFIINNGHTIQATYTKGYYSNDDAKSFFQISQFHFHTHSEEEVHGFADKASLHLVHAQNPGPSPAFPVALSVLGVLFVIGPDNPILDSIIAALPNLNCVGCSTQINFPGFQSTFEQIQANGTDDYWNFPGSLTTPPCSEKIDWTVLAHPWTISQAQLDALNAVLVSDTNSTTPGRSNYRNVQRTLGQNGIDLPYFPGFGMTIGSSFSLILFLLVALFF